MPKRIAGLSGLLVLFAALANAMSATIDWTLSPTPTVANITAGESVSWNGTFAFHPLIETDATFTQVGAFLNASGTTYSQVFATHGTYYYMCGVHGSSMPTTLNVVPACPTGPFAGLDIDADGTVEALTDDLLLIRYFMGLRGKALTADAVGSCATRTLAADIEAHIAAYLAP